MWTPTNTEKCCATCVNWGGERKIRGTWSEVDSPSVRGKCYAGCYCSVTQGPSACEGRSCAKYELWPAIKR